MKIIEITEAPNSLAEYTQEVTEGPVIVTVGGKPVAALVSIKNADLETVTLSTSPEFIDLIERSRARLRAEGGISTEEMRRRLGLEKTE